LAVSGTSAAAHRRALVLFATSSVCFGLMAFGTKLLSPRIPGAQAAFVRFAAGLLPILLLPRLRQAARKIERKDLILYRGLFGGIAALLYFLSIAQIPVGVATLLNSTSPIWAVLFALAFLGERLRPVTLLPLFASFLGVWMVVRAHAPPGRLVAFGTWELVGVCSAALSGAALAATRAARRTEGSWSIFASFTLFGFLVSAPLALAAWTPPRLAEWALLAGVAGISILSQLLMTWSFRWLDNVTAGVLQQVSVVTSMGLGAAVLGERVTPGSIAGTLLTLGAVAAVLIVSARSERVAAPAPAGPL
jgi:drug/metabolite transporter (DMT)-like permease